MLLCLMKNEKYNFGIWIDIYQNEASVFKY